MIKIENGTEREKDRYEKEIDKKHKYIVFWFLVVYLMVIYRLLFSLLIVL